MPPKKLSRAAQRRLDRRNKRLEEEAKAAALAAQLAQQSAPAPAPVVKKAPAPVPVVQAKASPQRAQAPQQKSLMQQMQKLQVSEPTEYRNRQPLSTGDVCLRKEPGTAGAPVRVTTNVFPLQFTPKVIHRWVVEFDPQIPPERIKQRRIVFGRFARTLREQFSFFSFDGTCLLTIEKPQPHIQFSGDDNSINIRHIKEIPTSVTSSQEVNNVVNVMSKKLLRSLGLILFGRSYYHKDPKDVRVQYRNNVPQHQRFNLQLYTGFTATVQPTVLGNVMTVDLTNRVMNKESVRQVLNRMEAKAREDRLTRAMYHERMKLLLVGRVVLAPHNNRIWRIDDVDFTKNVESKFTRRDNSTISFREYYITRYPEVKDKVAASTKPGLLVNRPTKARTTLKETILLPELCYLTGMTDEMKANFTLMKALAEHTRLPPTRRVLEIRRLVRTILEKKSDPNDPRGPRPELPIKLGARPVEMNGRILPPVAIEMPNGRFPLRQKKQFASPIRCAGFFGGRPKISQWAIVFDRKDGRACQTFSQNLLQQANQQKVLMNPKPRTVAVTTSRKAESWKLAIDQACSQGLPDFICIVIPRDENIYSFVKHWCNVQRGVVSQVVCLDTIRKVKALKTISCSVFKQIMAKMGYQNWRVNVKQVLGSEAKQTMIVGVDVSHDKYTKKVYGAKGVHRSTVGFVATRDDTFNSFNSFLSYQEPLVDMITEAQRLMTDALKAWFKEHKSFPKNIIVYRDGVGDSQLNTFVRVEIKNYEAAFNALGTNPKLTVIIVQKRISLRIFTPERTRQGQPPRFRSPSAGTVVDNSITSAVLSDFYLIPSEAPPKACSRPTRFITVRDDLNISNDKLQQMTNQMCYMYYNWSGPIRVPACVMYAHKLAYLFGKLVVGNPKLTLSQKMFYL